MGLHLVEDEKMDQNYFMIQNGISVVELTEEHAVLRAEITQKSLNPYGYVHGGLLFTMADCAAGLLARTDGRNYVTQTAAGNFIGNVKSGVIIAKSSVVSRKKRISVMQVDIYCEETLLADFSVNMYCVS